MKNDKIVRNPVSEGGGLGASFAAVAPKPPTFDPAAQERLERKRKKDEEFARYARAVNAMPWQMKIYYL